MLPSQPNLIHLLSYSVRAADLIVALTVLLLPFPILGLLRRSLPTGMRTPPAFITFAGSTALMAAISVAIHADPTSNGLGYAKLLCAAAALLSATWIWCRYPDLKVTITESRGREAAELQAVGNDRLFAFADSLECPAWIQGPNGAVYFYNEFCARFAQIPRGLSYHDIWLGLVHPAERPAAEEAWKDCFANGRPFLRELRMREASTGEYRRFFVKLVPMTGPGGRVERWFGSGALSEASLAAELLGNERNRLARILDSSPAAVGIFSGPEMRCEFSDPKLRQLLGAEQPEGRLLRDLLPDRSHEALVRILAEARANGGRAGPREARVTVGGEEGTGPARYFALRGAVIPAEGGGAETSVLYAYDISEERKAREALRGSEARFRRLFSSNLIGMFFWNVHGEITDANEAFLELTGWERSDLTELRLEALTPPEYRPAEGRTAEELSASAFATPYEKEIFQKGGGRLPVLAGSAWVSQDQGEGVGFVLDLTAQKKAEEERLRLLAHAESAREAARLKGQFFANISHEIRTPLHAVLGFARLLRQSRLGEEQLAFLRGIETSGENLLRLINDILDLSKLEARRLSFEIEELDFAEVLAEAAEMVEAAHPSAVPIRILPPSNSGPCRVKADRVRLSQLLTNIIGNAAKFTRQGGIDVHWRSQAEGTDECITVEVIDTGVGIDAASLARLFRPFEQADGTHSRQFSGTGLGLWISRNLAQLMGGDVTLASKPNRGTTATITVRLPNVTETPEVKKPAPGKREEPYFPGAHVLLAEDNLMNQTIARKLLERLGCAVSVTENGTDTLARLEKESFDLLLLDCQMPDTDGYTVARTIRKHEAKENAARLPIVAVTADAMLGTRQRCQEAGMDDYLTKSIDYALFLELLEQRLGAFRAAPPARPTEPILDEKVLEQLLRIDANGQLVREVLRIFLDATPSRLARLRKLSEEGDVRGTGRELHSLKASFGSVGLRNLAEVCAAAEKRLKAGPLRNEDLKEIYEDYPEAETALRAWGTAYAPAPRTGEPGEGASDPFKP